MALGGSRGRLARLLFTESLIVAMAVRFSDWSSALERCAAGPQLSTWESAISLELALDWRVLDSRSARQRLSDCRPCRARARAEERCRW
jgi:hypothetical protein